MSNRPRLEAGDPRRPNEVKLYEAPEVDAEKQQDPVLLIGMLLGVGGTLLKNKYCAWLSIVFCISGFSNTKHESADIKQLITSLMFALMALAHAYFAPPVPGPRGAKAG